MWVRVPLFPPFYFIFVQSKGDNMDKETMDLQKEMVAYWAGVLKELRKPFSAKDIEWRIGRKSNDGQRGSALAYLDARAISNRLDDMIDRGVIADWSVSYRTIDNGSMKQQRRGQEIEVPIKGFIASLSITDIYGTYHVREDGSNVTDFEPVKGGLSGAFKRAAAMWGIGRYLYDLPAVWVPIDRFGNIVTPPRLPVWALPEGETQEQAPVQQEEAAPQYDDFNPEAYVAPATEENPFTQNYDAQPTGEVIYPFGKYKGTPVSQLPLQYCQWALQNMKKLPANIKAALQERANG